MSLKHALPLSALAAVALCATAQEAAPAAEAAPAPETPAAQDAVAVRINGVDAVMQSEIDEALEQFLASNGSHIPPDQIERTKREVAREMADNFAMQWLLKAEADKAGVTVTDEDRAATLKRFGFADRDAAVKAFGVSSERFDKIFDTNIAIQKLLESQTNGIAAPTEEDVRAKFDEIAKARPEALNRPESVTASHILVKVDKGASDEDKAAARAKIDGIRQRALDGEDFAALAKENSDCPSSAKGGDLGTFGRGQMVKPFEDAAFSQEIGVVGPVVETQFGFHVVKVTDRKEAGTIGFDDVKDELSSGMLREKTSSAVRSFIEKVRGGADIQMVSPAFEVVSDVVEVPAPEPPKERKLPEWAM